MNGVLGSLALAVLLGLVGTRPAAALCICDAFGDCSSAAACVGKNPGDTCSPPRNATCKIVAGNGNGLSCCCGCSRGQGPISCLYTPVAEQLALLGETVCAAAATTPAPLGQACICADRKLDKQTDKVVTGAQNDLRKADAACRKGKSATKRANAGRKKVGKLKKRIARALADDDITSDCATALNQLVDDFIVDIDQAGQGGGTATTTTTTTLPSGPTCTPTFTSAPGFPDEVDFHVVCQGGNDVLGGFTIEMAPGFQITNRIDPPGFTCLFAGPTDTFPCTGPFAFGDTITGGRLHTVPPPGTPGFGATLVIKGQDGNDVVGGPFPFTGP